jgi:hypothetical protein
MIWNDSAAHHSSLPPNETDPAGGKQTFDPSFYNFSSFKAWVKTFTGVYVRNF